MVSDSSSLVLTSEVYALSHTDSDSSSLDLMGEVCTLSLTQSVTPLPQLSWAKEACGLSHTVSDSSSLALMGNESISCHAGYQIAPAHSVSIALQWHLPQISAHRDPGQRISLTLPLEAPPPIQIF